MMETPSSNYTTKQGNSMFEKDSSSQPLQDLSSAEKICQALQSLIEKESAHDPKGAAKLQEAYDILEEFKTEEGSETPGEENSETGSPEGADQAENGAGANGTLHSGNINTGLLMGPMSNLKNYLAKKSVDTQARPFVS
jgi:hypothetical protein